MSRIYGLKPTPKNHPLWARPFYHELREALFMSRHLLAPEPVDLVDLTASVPPIRDQGQEGSCSGFQTRNVRMLAHTMAAGSQPSWDLSPAFAYWQARALDSEQTKDSGETIGNELAGVEAYGLCEESFMPYVAGQYATPPSSEALANALTHKANLQAVPVDYSSFANVHQVLADGHPIIGGFSVPPSFEAVGSDGALPDPTGEPDLGGHAFSICAIKLSDGWMRDPNSWGTGWGQNGFGYMPATYLGRVFELWAIIPTL
jgi:C1A family cysteine protease